MILRREEGCFFHCLPVERVCDAEALEILGGQTRMFVRKMAVLFDVEYELWSGRVRI